MMKKMKTKIDALLWAVIWCLPFIGYFTQYYRAGTATSILQYIDANFAVDFLKNIFDNVFSTAFDSTFALSGLLSYLCFVEIAHVLFDVVVFLPRFAHDFVDRCGHVGGDR